MSAKSVVARAGSLQEIDVQAWRRDLIVNILITTACDRYCPLCCYKSVIREDSIHHFTPESIAAAVAAVGDVGVVYLLGGEPTLHPAFEDVLKEARAARGSRPLRLVTNGARLLLHAAATRYVDLVWLSLLGDVVGAEIAEKFAQIKPVGVEFVSPAANHYDLGGGIIPCSYLYNTVSVLDLRVYPCCVACGIAGAQSVALQPGWEYNLLKVEAPCESCFNGRTGG